MCPRVRTPWGNALSFVREFPESGRKPAFLGTASCKSLFFQSFADNIRFVAEPLQRKPFFFYPCNCDRQPGLYMWVIIRHFRISNEPTFPSMQDCSHPMIRAPFGPAR